MKVDVKVPSVGESITEAIVATLIVPSGTFVKKDAEILELETDKVNQVVYAPEDGVVTWSVSVDDTVSVGSVLGSVDTEGKGSAPEAKAPEKPKAESPTQAAPAKPTAASDGPPARVMPEAHLGAAPAAATTAAASAPALTPTPAAPSPKAPTPSGTTTRKRMSGLRRTIAKKLVEVKNQTAMLTTFNEVDMSKVMELRAQEKDKFMKTHGVKLGFMSFFITAATAALKAFPDVGAYLEGDEIVINHDIHIGISVSTDKGLMVPVIRSCQEKGFASLEQELVNYAKQAREGKIAISDLQGGIFTITNGGTFGSMLSTPILNPPQSAILGMHNIVKRPMVVDDKIVIRPIMYLALSYDHRVVDGKEAVSFLVHIKQHLEDPARLLLDF
ncbi:MAG: Dihydrolipoyllysine-residue succinyltransferase component of 2-oxoglutarate dehydrogenase complex [Chlamydiia bacterium]|nr:Dihydrolipoyllysine-residue succinyltransferase component of 2-oxoglutarate dehydrogenase complex [Chlamydiia bacterium]MCH9615529.1 Dihydrolipoyllysine-residue succinyltransferase component of 2-oxoglutarate dehydrogenase complex [Chlamydiia bacterium]MCH9629184.1 Dihydrolipoyllysine-residue succinyltransferase component of 2-oxoglutarate dehydrogenase complex [Chlamydiia bacterium]